MLTKNLPELIFMLNKYKNPYIIPKYIGKDWHYYKKYQNNINILRLSDNLILISMIKDQYYKIYNQDFIYILEGDLLIDYKKKISESYFYYDTCDNPLQDKTSFILCKGLSHYNTFLYYKSL